MKAGLQMSFHYLNARTLLDIPRRPAGHLLHGHMVHAPTRQAAFQMGPMWNSDLEAGQACPLRQGLSSMRAHVS